MEYVQLADLALGSRLSSGSQGEVYALAGSSDTVAKLYRELNGIRLVPDALDELVRIGKWLTSEGRSVHAIAAWPHTVVLRGAETAGFLMSRIGEPFMVGIGPSAYLAELGLLLGGHPGTLGTPDVAKRLHVLRELAAALVTLHGHGLVFGDLSPRNIAWAVQPVPRIMLLDCDGIRRTGHPGVLPHAETRNWEDPLNIGSSPSPDSDNYKLAMAVVRVLTGNASVRPGQSVNLTAIGAAGIQTRPLVTLLHRAAGPVGSRPTALEWTDALDIRTSRVRQAPISRTTPSKARQPWRRPFRLRTR